MALRPLSALRSYQPPAIDKMVETEQVACLLFPGLGKTICALTAFCILVTRGRCKRAIVIAPSQVVENEVWSREAGAWEHTAHLRVTEIYGTAKQRVAKAMLDSDIIVISFENLIWLTNILRRDYFDCLVMDELSKLKHPNTKRFKRLARSEWLKSIPIRFGLTGSPVGNNWMDLWGEMFMVCGERAGLGRTKEEFTARYFMLEHRKNSKFPTYKIKGDGSIQEIQRLIRPHAFSLSRKLAARELPEVIDNPIRIKMPKQFLDMEKKLRRELELVLPSGTPITALNGSALQQKVRQLASGAVYTAGPEVNPRPWEELHRLKLDALSNLHDELQGEPLLIYVWFKHEAERLGRDFGAVMFDKSVAMSNSWNRKEIPYMMMNPLSTHGVNLQYGGCNTVWLSNPHSRELYDQGNGREARLGQPSPYVMAHSLLVGAVDFYIWDRTLEKGEAEAGFMRSMELVQFDVEPTDDGGGRETGFERC